MDFLTPYYNAWAVAIKAAWPEVAANGIWHGMDLATSAFEKRMSAGKVPFVAMDFALRASDDWGFANRVDEGPVTIYYVVRNDSGFETAIGKAHTLREYVWANGLAAGKIKGWPSATADMSLPANQYFLSANKPFIAAAVIAWGICGEVP